jgi:hypothetical protein
MWKATRGFFWDSFGGYSHFLIQVNKYRRYSCESALYPKRRLASSPVSLCNALYQAALKIVTMMAVSNEKCDDAKSTDRQTNKESAQESFSFLSSSLTFQYHRRCL